MVLVLASRAAAAPTDDVPRKAPDGLVNLALDPAVKVTASSVYQEGKIANHQVRHLNDGKYGNQHSWVAAEQPAWVEIDLGRPCTVCRVAMGRDATGQVDDRSATRFDVLLAEELDPATARPKWQNVLDYQGEPVSRRTEFRLCPRAARWVRIVFHTATTTPVCVDELEVYASTSPETLAWARATAPPVRQRSTREGVAPQCGPVVELPEGYPLSDPAPCRRPATPLAVCLNGDDWRMALVEQGHGSLRGMIDGDPSGWLVCNVPGSVQAGLLRGGKARWNDYEVPRPEYFGTNVLHLLPSTANQSWFRKSFQVPAEWKGKRVRLRLAAVDYDAKFYLNGKEIGRHVGHYSPVTLDVTDGVRPGAENRLAVEIAPFVNDRTRQARSQKFKNMPGDCDPAAGPLGISDDVFLLASDTLYVEDLCVRPTLADDFSRAAVEIRLSAQSLADLDAQVEYTIRSLQEPKQTFRSTEKAHFSKGSSTVTHSVEVAEPQLWWPNGAGKQNLYEVQATVRAADGRTLDVSAEPFGIRKLQMAFNEGAEAARFPWTFVVNGKKIYAKGGNWVPPDLFYRTDAAMYERLILHAKAAHFNMFRWWGGGPPERDAFYDLCDRHGIMLFHDFFLANGDFNHPEFLKLLETEARAFVRRHRNHPSIVLWTGGNEFGECDATRLLGKVAAEEDPTRAYRPPSPTDGEHHGDYAYYPPKFYADCNSNVFPRHSKPQFAQVRSEFACCAAANADTLRKIIPGGELAELPGSDPQGPSWKLHNSHNWMNHSATYAFYGPISDLDTYCAASQFARAEGLRYAIEAMRRKKFRTSATLYWQYNESWPNAAGNATVDWFAQPRLTHYYAMKAHEPVHVSLEYDKTNWPAGQPFSAGLWATSDRFEDVPSAEVAWSIVAADGRRVAGGAKTVTLAANRSAEIDQVTWDVPKGYNSFFVVYCTIRDTATDQTLSKNEYVHFAHHSTTHPWSVLLGAPATELAAAIRVQGKHAAEVTVSNQGKSNALVCTLSLPVPAGAIVLFDDNAFCLPPGGKRTVSVRALNPSKRDWAADFSALAVKAWNSGRVAIIAALPTKD